MYREVYYNQYRIQQDGDNNLDSRLVSKMWWIPPLTAQYFSDWHIYTHLKLQVPLCGELAIGRVLPDEHNDLMLVQLDDDSSHDWKV